MKQILYILIFIIVACKESTVNDTGSQKNKKGSIDTSVVVIDKPSVDTLTRFLSEYPLVSWARKSPVEIGCMLESEFSYRNSVFNCDYKKYSNDGDPCVNTKEYYEGLEFPAHLVSKVHPLIKDITLDFEHGDLREIAITFSDSIRKDRVRKLFNLPEESEYPENIMQILYGENVYSKDKPVNPEYTRWLTITGFEHMGAGDVDCE